MSPIMATRRLSRMVRHAATVQVREMALMGVLTAMAPLSLAGRGFDWAAAALSPSAPPTAAVARPVLLVHGFAGTTSCWLPLARALHAKGVMVAAVNYTPFGRSVEQLADQLAVKVADLLASTGADKVHLVGHSLGGLIIAQAIASGRLAGQVDTVVTIGTPFGGSPWANLLPLAATVRALRGGSPLLRRLCATPAPHGVRWLAFTASLDVIVPGHRSVPPCGGTQSVTIEDVGHVGVLMSPQVVSRIVAALPRQDAA